MSSQKRLENIQICKSIAEMMKSLLGPKSLDKLIIEKDGDLTLTNDGATALSTLQIDNPIGKLLVQLSKSMDDETGDGTTSVVVLAGALLDKASILLHKGLHPMNIIRGYAIACERAVEILSSLSIKFDPLSPEGKKILIETSQTTLGSKIVSFSAPHVASLAVEAVTTHAKNHGIDRIYSFDISKVKVVCIEGGSMNESSIRNSILLEENDGMKLSFSGNKKNVKLAILQFSLEKPKTTENYQIVAQNAMQIDRIIKEEENYVRSLVVKLKKIGMDSENIELIVKGITTVIIEQNIFSEGISKSAEQFLRKAGMIAFLLPHSDIEYICEVASLSPITGPELLDNPLPSSRISLFNVSKETFGNKSFIVLEKVGENSSENSSAAMTVILRGVSEIALAEAERSFHDAVCVVRNLLIKPEVVLGGGVTETEICVQLFKESTKNANADPMVLQAFAEALEEIPITLASNGGMDAMTTMAQLKWRHNQGETFTGINLQKLCIDDLRLVKVWEPYINKQSQITMATEAAISILRIDDVIGVP